MLVKVSFHSASTPALKVLLPALTPFPGIRMRGVALRVGPFIAAMPVTVVLPFEPKKVSEASAVNELSKVPPMPLQLNNPKGSLHLESHRCPLKPWR